MADEPRIAAAVGVAVVIRDNPALASQIELAMAQAVTDALADGIAMSDTGTIRARMLVARDALLTPAKEN